MSCHCSLSWKWKMWHNCQTNGKLSPPIVSSDRFFSKNSKVSHGTRQLPNPKTVTDGHIFGFITGYHQPAKSKCRQRYQNSSPPVFFSPIFLTWWASGLEETQWGSWWAAQILWHIREKTFGAHCRFLRWTLPMSGQGSGGGAHRGSFVISLRIPIRNILEQLFDPSGDSECERRNVRWFLFSHFHLPDHLIHHVL